ncbi:DsbA family protein [Cognatishimia activa]|uniref:Thiol-disulfide oxidoreductase D n=1 Tax=Cognatishimia activa TaxID=1715691 RepID=A0A0P1INS2_9RHOB|nr:DsbA family protein [Cognatishimia activa]CUJ28753.1 Thiol-disulfide oxidoreductase D [Cognatishimia activa]CUK25243.1 Thiol-disulfide oxidoreductase D [Cognatishimia activa]
MKTPLLAAAFAVLAMPSWALDLEKMSDEERALFREEVRAYLLDNPEVIMEAVAVLEERQAAGQARQDFDLVAINADDIFNDGYSYVGGNPDGDITLVEFVDYRCGFCRRAHPEVQELVASDGNIRIITKEFPILGEASTQSSRFAIAVKQIAGDDAYEAANDALIKMRADANPVTLKRLAKNLGLDSDAIIAHMGSNEVTEEIRKTRELAQRLQITGTPTFVLEDEMLRGYLPLNEMRRMVAAKRG